MPSKLILVVDDNMDARFVFAAILNFDGYRIIEALNGERGVAYALEHKPDLILMDINMPTMDGFRAAELIRENELARGIPIIAVTANSFNQDQTRRARLLFNGWLTKPVTAYTVLAEVQRMIGPPR
jgi:CheY-like chemotaxis protein